VLSFLGSASMFPGSKIMDRVPLQLDVQPEALGQGGMAGVTAATLSASSPVQAILPESFGIKVASQGYICTLPLQQLPAAVTKFAAEFRSLNMVAGSRHILQACSYGVACTRVSRPGTANESVSGRIKEHAGPGSHTWSC
jgi:hypothetical protein